MCLCVCAFLVNLSQSKIIQHTLLILAINIEVALQILLSILRERISFVEITAIILFVALESYKIQHWY